MKNSNWAGNDERDDDAIQKLTNELLNQMKQSRDGFQTLKPKLIQDFDGSQDNWTKWKSNNTKATLHAIDHKGILDESREIAYWQQNQNSALGGTLILACSGGSASSKITKFEDTSDGHAAWKELLEWYDSDSQQEAYFGSDRKNCLEILLLRGMKSKLSGEYLTQKLAQGPANANGTLSSTINPDLKGILRVPSDQWSGLCKLHRDWVLLYNRSDRHKDPALPTNTPEGITVGAPQEDDGLNNTDIYPRGKPRRVRHVTSPVNTPVVCKDNTTFIPGLPPPTRPSASNAEESIGPIDESAPFPPGGSTKLRTVRFHLHSERGDEQTQGQATEQQNPAARRLKMVVLLNKARENKSDDETDLDNEGDEDMIPKLPTANKKKNHARPRRQRQLQALRRYREVKPADDNIAVIDRNHFPDDVCHLDIMDVKFQPCIQYKRTFDVTEAHDSHKLVVDYERATNQSTGKKNIRREYQQTDGTPNGANAYREGPGRDGMRPWLTEPSSTPRKDSIITPDPDAKGTMIAAFEHQHMAKPMEVSEHDHFSRIDTILHYIDMLPGDVDNDLTKQQRKRMFFKTHPRSWQDSYMNTAVNFREDSDKESGKEEDSEEEEDPEEKMVENAGIICKETTRGINVISTQRIKHPIHNTLGRFGGQGAGGRSSNESNHNWEQQSHQGGDAFSNMMTSDASYYTTNQNQRQCERLETHVNAMPEPMATRIESGLQATVV
eukprot:jgi/Psemu1/39720/gm1.39720_g